MNKQQTAAQLILEAHSATPELTEAILAILTNAKGPAQPANPNYIDNDIEYKYCVRHEMYHPLTDFTIKKNGTYDHNCDVAVGQWRAITKDIRIAEKLIPTLIGSDKLEAHIVSIEALKSKRLNKYPFENIVPTKEEAPIKPKRGGKK